MITKFFGTVENGRLVLDNEPAYFSTLFALNGEIELVIQKRKRSRTLKQNAYYRGVVVPMIAKETGDSDKRMHEILKRKFLKDFTFINGEVFYFSRTTTTLTTKQFVEYIDEIKLWALDFLNLNIPDADEVYE